MSPKEMIVRESSAGRIRPSELLGAGTKMVPWQLQMGQVNGTSLGTGLRLGLIINQACTSQSVFLVWLGFGTHFPSLVPVYPLSQR